MSKSVKSQKKQQRKKKSSKKLFNITEDKTDIAIGVVAAAGLLGLGYATVIAPILEEKKLRAREAKEAEELKNTVEKTMVQRRESAKVKALKAYEDIKQKLAETVVPREPRVSVPSTTPRSPGFPKFPGFYSPTATAKGSPVKPPILDGIPKNSQKLPAPIVSTPPVVPVVLAVPVVPVVPVKESPKVSAGLKPPIFSILEGIEVSNSKKIKNSTKTAAKSVPYSTFTGITNRKIFTTNQKRNIVSLIEEGKDTSPYIKRIVGDDYIPSTIKLHKDDPVELYLHVIKGAVMKHLDSHILRGMQKLREKIFLQQDQPIVPNFINVRDGKNSKNPGIFPN